MLALKPCRRYWKSGCSTSQYLVAQVCVRWMSKRRQVDAGNWIIKSQCHAQCVRDKLAPPPSVAFSLIEVLLQPTTALTAAHNNFDAAYCRPYCSLLA